MPFASVIEAETMSNYLKRGKEKSTHGQSYHKFLNISTYKERYSGSSDESDKRRDG